MSKEREALAANSVSKDGPASLGQALSRHRHSIASAPFAGRIGGNQEFIATGDDEATEEILKRQPDAVR